MQWVLTQWLTLPAATFGLENNYHAKGGGIYIMQSAKMGCYNAAALDFFSYHTVATARSNSILQKSSVRCQVGSNTGLIERPESELQQHTVTLGNDCG